MKRVILMILTAGIMAVTPALAADVKFGYIDMQRALNTSDAGKEAKEQLSGRLKKYQDDINQKQNDLKKLKDELEKQGALLSESARGAKEKDYQQKLKELQRSAKDAEDDLRGKDEESARKIFEAIDKIIQEFGRSKGYTFIFVRNEAMAFASDKADVTDEIIKLYNAGRKK